MITIWRATDVGPLHHIIMKLITQKINIVSVSKSPSTSVSVCNNDSIGAKKHKYYQHDHETIRRLDNTGYEIESGVSSS